MFTELRLHKKKPFHLLEAVQLEKAQTDMVLENLQKVIESILTEIRDMCDQMELDISTLP